MSSCFSASTAELTSHSPWGECDIYAGLLARTFLLDVNSDTASKQKEVGQL